MSTGKRGKKEKNKFCYIKDLSATGPLLGNLGVFPFVRGKCAVGSTAIVDQ